MPYQEFFRQLLNALRPELIMEDRSIRHIKGNPRDNEAGLISHGRFWNVYYD